MAKTIKFNLICDNKPIRTIDDLQNNFSIEDVLAYYSNGLLHRWLDVRDYKEELEKVRAITADKPIDIVKELIKIFGIINDAKRIEEGVYILQYLEERKELYSIYEKENYKTKTVIDDYVVGYRQLIEGIQQNPHDAAIIKANISEIVSNYAWILELDCRRLFYSLINMSPLAIMCLLMNEHSRKYYLPVEVKKEDKIVPYDTESNKKPAGIEAVGIYRSLMYKYNTPICDEGKDEGEDRDKAAMFRRICSMIKKTDFITELGDNLMAFSGVTDGYWKDLEPKGKKYMIIHMGDGDFVRSAGMSGGDLSSADIEDKFVIIDGIDYKSNSSSRQLLYMEV